MTGAHDNEPPHPDSLRFVNETTSATTLRRLGFGIAVVSTLTPLLLLVGFQGNVLVVVVLGAFCFIWWTRVVFCRVVAVSDAPPGVLIAARGRQSFVAFSALDSYAALYFGSGSAKLVDLIFKKGHSPWGARHGYACSDSSNGLLPRLHDYFEASRGPSSPSRSSDPT